MKIDLIIPASEKSEIKTENIVNSKFINLIIERGSNPSENRNRGVNKSKNELIAFTNSHSLLDKFWYQEAIKFFKDYPKIDIVGGPQLTLKNEQLFGRASGYAFSSFFGSAIMLKRYKRGKVNLKADETMLTSANLICKRKVFEKIRFDENIYPGEDPKFISDALKNEFKIAYSPNIIVYNLRRKNIRLLAKQIYLYGLKRLKKEKMGETLKKPFFFIPSLFLIYLVLLPLLIFLSKYFLLPLIFYLSLNLFFSAYESVKNKDFLSFLPLLVIFPTIHLSYGIGFLKGVLNES